MARIRTIKPEFFTSEDIVALSPMARLLYIAVWCEADREGRLAWKPRTLKLRYFPGDACDIEALADELVEGGLVRLYGDGLAFIPSFTEHQHLNPREAESKLPEPGIARVTHASSRVVTRQARDSDAQGGREGKGKEGEEAEARIRPATVAEPESPDAPASVTPLAESAAASDAVVDRVLAEYPTTLPDCQRVSVLTAKRRRLVLAADKLARRFCRERGLDYGPAFWALFWAECAEDEWLAGRKPNPNNPAWKQSIDVLLREDTIARVLDAVVSRKEAA